MIRINLLPVRAFRRKQTVRKQVIIFLVIVVVFLGLMGVVYATTLGGLWNLKEEEENLKAQKVELAKKVKIIDDMLKEEKSLQEKLEIIARLESLRRGPVRVLDEISRRIPANQAWLISLQEDSSNKLNLRGVAMDNETIALLMANLESSPYLANVELVRSAQEIRQKIPLKSFAINCTIVTPENKKEDKKEGKKEVTTPPKETK